MKKLPTGIQVLREILEEGYVYVDKTGIAKELIDNGKHYFISRPRRFGKSLFLNTLEEIFKGNKELFKGCAIYQSDYHWEKHPILYLDFARISGRSTEELERDLKETLQEIASLHKIPIGGPSVESYLRKLIAGLAKKQRVVVLVDEYDQPIISNIKNAEIAEQNRDLLRSFFSAVKSLDRYIEFSFVTGISKFSHVSLFSGLNNLNDITMDPKYAGIMGYTDEEIRHHFPDHIRSIVKEKGSCVEEVMEEMRTWYNGYRFSKDTLCVYNPFSTLSYLGKKEATGYWYRTGTPSFLIDQLKAYPQSMVALDGSHATEDDLMDISSLEEIDAKALMYQTGYFTVQGYNEISARYQLGLPNKEVRTAFMISLVKHFTKTSDVRSSEKFIKALEEYRLDFLFDHIKAGFASFAYQVFAGAKERTYQAMLLAMFYGMGFDPLSEKSTNTGRIDVALEMPKTTFILELKLDGSAENALCQIRDKAYFSPYLHKEKEVALIGANFSSEKRNVSEWVGELLSSSGEKVRDLH